MYYKLDNKFYSIGSDVNIVLDTYDKSISKMSDLSWRIIKFLNREQIREINHKEFNDALNIILSTLKINKFNFQFNGKK